MVGRRARFPEDRKGSSRSQLAMKVSDSSWHRQLSDLGKSGVDEPESLLAGAVPELQSRLSYLVGSYDRVAGEVCRFSTSANRTLFSTRRRAPMTCTIRRRFRARRKSLSSGLTVLLQHGVMAQSSARPTPVAIVLDDTRITYGTLDATQQRACPPADRRRLPPR